MRRMAAHGTTSKYSAGCRCDACRLMWRAYQQAYRAVKRLKGICQRCQAPATGNRCADCAETHALYCRDRRADQKQQEVAA